MLGHDAQLLVWIRDATEIRAAGELKSIAPGSAISSNEERSASIGLCRILLGALRIDGFSSLKTDLAMGAIAERFV